MIVNLKIWAGGGGDQSIDLSKSNEVERGMEIEGNKRIRRKS